MKLHKVMTALFATSVASAGSHAVTLGEIRVNSYLSQPLDAEIDLVGLAPGQHLDLRLRIANDAYLQRMGIVADPLLRELDFDVVRSGTQWLVRARSRRPIREPFLEFPLQMSWAGGQLIRKYTLLFDPPQRVQPARAASVRRPASRPAPTRSATADDTGVDTYGPVRSGEALWNIAQRLKPSGTSTRSMMIALLRANPEAFIDGDMNKLRAGATLRIPLHGFIEKTAAGSQPAAPPTQDRGRLTDNVGASPRTLERVTDHSSAGSSQDAEQAERRETAGEKPLRPQAQDRLRVVKAVEDTPTRPAHTEQALHDQLLVKLEQIESQLLTTQEMTTRLSRLEDELQRMQRLIELKDAQITALQAEAAEAEDPAKGAAPSGRATPASAAALPGDDLRSARQDDGTARSTTDGLPGETLTVSQDTAFASDAQAPISRPWYRQPLWLAPAVLVPLGLGVLFGLWHRRRTARVGLAAGGLPVPTCAGGAASVSAAAPVPGDAPMADLAAAEVLESAALQKAAEDFRRLARERLSPGPQADAAAPTGGTAPSRAVAETPCYVTPASLDIAGIQVDVATDELAEDDIESWARELDFERVPSRGSADATEPQSAAAVDAPRRQEQAEDSTQATIELEIPPEATDLDTDPGPPRGSEREIAQTPVTLEIPSDAADRDADPDPQSEPVRVIAEAPVTLEIPSEANDLDASRETHPVQPLAGDEQHDDDAYSMSLDLARAYVEMGDRDEARGILDEALSGARHPDLRREIEELLRQIA